MVTTRQKATGRGEYKGFNTSLYVGDDVQTVLQNRAEVCTFFNSENLFIPHQTHSANILQIDEEFLKLNNEQQKNQLENIDALITNLPNVIVGITTADCVPILLYAPDKHVVAAVHAGWRGTIKRILEKTIMCMVEQYGVNVLEIRVGIGPCISVENYEVGEELIQNFKDNGFVKEEYFQFYENKNPHLNLKMINRDQVLNCGVLLKNIEISPYCTFDNNDLFYSARRQGILSGRILSAIKG